MKAASCGSARDRAGNGHDACAMYDLHGHVRQEKQKFNPESWFLRHLALKFQNELGFFYAITGGEVQRNDLACVR